MVYRTAPFSMTLNDPNPNFRAAVGMGIPMGMGMGIKIQSPRQSCQISRLGHY